MRRTKKKKEKRRMSRLEYAKAVISAECGEGKETEEEEANEEEVFKYKVTKWEVGELEVTADEGEGKEKYARVTWRVGGEIQGTLHVESDYWLYAWLPEDGGKDGWEEDGPNDLAEEEEKAQKEIEAVVRAVVKVAKEQERGWMDEESPLRPRMRKEAQKRARRDQSPSRQ